jgi:hypothetical protein
MRPQIAYEALILYRIPSDICPCRAALAIPIMPKLSWRIAMLREKSDAFALYPTQLFMEAFIFHFV